MKALTWMVAAGVGSWACLAITLGDRVNPEVLWGMIGPLAVAVVSWLAVERAWAARPEGVLGLLLGGMAIKLIFFAAYVFVMLRVLSLRPVPFVASFTGYFIALHNIEALFMKRLFTSAC
jgi:hypothetical protein